MMKVPPLPPIWQKGHDQLVWLMAPSSLSSHHLLSLYPPHPSGWGYVPFSKRKRALQAPKNISLFIGAANLRPCRTPAPTAPPRSPPRTQTASPQPSHPSPPWLLDPVGRGGGSLGPGTGPSRLVDLRRRQRTRGGEHGQLILHCTITDPGCRKVPKGILTAGSRE
jgi:hypothetical protein